MVSSSFTWCWSQEIVNFLIKNFLAVAVLRSFQTILTKNSLSFVIFHFTQECVCVCVCHLSLHTRVGWQHFLIFHFTQECVYLSLHTRVCLSFTSHKSAFIFHLTQECAFIFDFTQAYILKAKILTPTIPQKNLNFPQICPKMPKNGPKMTQSGPNMTQNGPKWPKNNPKWPKMAQKWPALFPQFFLTGKAVPQTFSLLECMFSSSP